MSKVILTSSFSSVAKALYDKNLLPHEAVAVGFVTTAADPYTDKLWMENDRQALLSLGYKVIDIDLKNQNADSLRSAFHDARIIFVAGGNTTYLVEWARRSGFHEVIRELLSDNRIFIGSSAGSILAGPTVEPFVPEDIADLSKDFLLKDPQCFGLVDYVVLPHYPSYATNNDRIADDYGDRLKFVKLRDDEYRTEEI